MVRCRLTATVPVAENASAAAAPDSARQAEELRAELSPCHQIAPPVRCRTKDQRMALAVYWAGLDQQAQDLAAPAAVLPAAAGRDREDSYALHYTYV